MKPRSSLSYQNISRAKDHIQLIETGLERFVICGKGVIIAVLRRLSGDEASVNDDHVIVPAGVVFRRYVQVAKQDCYKGAVLRRDVPFVVRFWRVESWVVHGGYCGFVVLACLYAIAVVGANATTGDI